MISADTLPVTYYDVEYTDTFGGEANYCWIKRHCIEVKQTLDMDQKKVDAKVKRMAKAAVGLNGAAGEWTDYGGQLEFRPSGMATILLVNWHDCSAHANCDHKKS